MTSQTTGEIPRSEVSPSLIMFLISSGMINSAFERWNFLVSEFDFPDPYLKFKPFVELMKC